MSGVPFTGERLHAQQELFQVDLARHRAAYRFAQERSREARVLDFGCGSGYGTAELGQTSPLVIGVDRVPPDPEARRGNARFVRADLNRIPLASRAFDLVVSFQVIEHLEDPGDYLRAIAQALKPGGCALITTPNRLCSDGENPYHVHEYLAKELADRLSPYFASVELRGVGATPPVAAYHAARLERIRRITRLDPLRLRRRLPRGLVERLFALFAIVVRRAIRQADAMPDASWRDFPIGPVTDDCLDLLAICHAAPAESP